jgi:hypothetical protein
MPTNINASLAHPLKHPTAPSTLSSSRRAVQIISRDIHRLANSFDFFRLLSFYYGGSGFYISTYMTVMFVYVYLYCRLILMLPPVADLLSTGSIDIRFELLQVHSDGDSRTTMLAATTIH